MIQGRVELAQHEVVVQDGQLMIFIPGAEGGSEPLDAGTGDKLLFLLHLVRENLNAQEA